MLSELWSDIRYRLRAILRRDAIERDLDEELRFHIDRQVEKHIAEGAAPAEARRRARLEFGSMDRIKEETRDVHGTRPFEEMRHDLRHALRQLRANAGFTALAVITLALGICAIASIDAFHRYIASAGATLSAPERLVHVGQGSATCGWCNTMAPANYLSVRDRVRALEYASMFIDWDPVVRTADMTDLADGARVTPEFFETLGVRPLLGRLFVPGDDTRGDRVVVVSEGAWQRRFGGDSAVVGLSIVLDGVPHTVVGVVPNHAVFPRGAELWSPLVLGQHELNDRSEPRYGVVGRLRAGVTVEAASAEVAGVAARLAAAFPAEMSGITFHAVSLSDLRRREPDARTLAAGLLLLIACVNLAGLLVARHSARRHELAVRRAMGATPGRIVRQLLAEVVLMGTCAGLLGAGAAALTTPTLIGWSGIGLDGRGFASAVLIGALCGVLVGLWPCVRFARSGLVSGLHDMTRSATPGVDGARGRRILVAVQVALAVVLLSAASLLARSYRAIYDIDAGFEVDGVLALRVRVPQLEAGPGTPPDRIDRLVRAIDGMPGIVRAGGVLGIPFGHGASRGRFQIEGDAPVPSRERPAARMQAATPGYFEALGIGILRGRDFAASDGPGAPPVAIVNEAFAAQFLADQDPIGRVILIDSVRWQVIGVARTVFHGDAEELLVPEIYRPLQQWHRPYVWIAVRSPEGPETLGPALRAGVRRFDADIPVTRMATVHELRAADMGAERRMLRVIATFAAAAIAVSALGLYGVISFFVAQRRREFGVRLALGAGSRSVLTLVIGQGVRLVALGTILGILGALAAARVIRSMLFRVSPTDPVALGGVVAVTFVVTLLAVCIPARRATLVDPMTSLRED